MPILKTQILESIADCREFRKYHRASRLALIPTMGALHEGHLTLLKQAKAHADVVVVSIFVNPTQFGPHEDFERYPRPLAQDLEKCRSMNVDAVFCPTVEVLYPQDLKLQPRLNQQGVNRTQVLPPVHLTEKFCGLSRPGHFTGVATVVLKLFNIVQPDLAVFGEKDAQQLAVIQTMVRDLNIPVEILPAPTARDTQGLALSSRNDYLKTPEEKCLALLPSLVLKRIQALTPEVSNRDKAFIFDQALREAEALLDVQATDYELDYLDAVDATTFEIVNTLGAGVKVLIACKIGQTRLIDNISLSSI